MSVLKTNRVSSARRRVPPAIVRFAPEFLQELLPQAQALSGPQKMNVIGLLFGRRDDDALTLEAIVAAPAKPPSHQSIFAPKLQADLDDLRSRSRLKPELSPLELLGWCSLERSGDPDDLPVGYAEFHSIAFRRASDVLLRVVVQTGGVLSGRVFTRVSGSPFSAAQCGSGAITIHAHNGALRHTEVKIRGPEDDLYQDIYARTAAADRAERRPHRLSTLRSGASHLKPASPAHPPGARAADQISAKTNALPRWPLRVGLALLLLAFAASLIAFRTRTSRAETATAVSDAKPHTRRLDLRIQRQTGGAFLVTWNRDAPAVRSAVSGIFEIRDGAFVHRSDLEPVELASGSILYTPRSSEIHVLLTVLDEDHRSVTDEVLFLDGADRSVANNAAYAPGEPAKPAHANPAQVASAVSAKEPPRGAPPAAFTSTTAAPQPPASHAPARSSKQPPNPAPEQTLLATPEQIAAAQSALDIAPPALERKPAPQPPPKPDSHSNAKASQTPSPPARSNRVAVPETASLAYIPPRPLRKVAPSRELLEASDFVGRRTIEVEVDIDDHGTVTAARIPTRATGEPGPAGMAALAAVKQWLFEPAKLHGQNASSKYRVVFEFLPPTQ